MILLLTDDGDLLLASAAQETQIHFCDSFSPEVSKLSSISGCQ